MGFIINFLIDMVAFIVVSAALFYLGLDYYSGIYWLIMLTLPIISINNYVYGRTKQ